MVKRLRIVLFLHGFQDVSFSADEKGGPLRVFLGPKGIIVICVSYSGEERTQQGLRLATEGLVAELKKRGITRIDVVVGHSMGGLVACHLAKSYRELGIRMVIMLESPVSGMPAWMLRIWVFVWQRRASYDWDSIQDMKPDSKFMTELFKDWPVHDIAVVQIMGSLSCGRLGRFLKTPTWIHTYEFPDVAHDGPTGLRGHPEVLECIAERIASVVDEV
jgi:pimeloyl-ACP methyl ester carboxylesterase